MPPSLIEPASPTPANLGLTSAQTAFFHEHGFLHMPGVISPRELTVLRRACDRLVAPASRAVVRNADYCYAHVDSTGSVLHRINNMLLKGPEFLQLWGHPRLLGMAESIQGSDMLPVALALVMKTPGCGLAVPWHRDPAFSTRAWGTNLGIYLDDADAENGMLHVIPGSHRRRCFDLAQAVAEHGFDLPGAIPVPVRAGDVILHNENLLHGSRQVQSQRQRRVLYFGIRCIPEQLSLRGLDEQWVLAYGRILRLAIRSRGIGTFDVETPFTWHACDPRYHQVLEEDAYVELRIDGCDGHADPTLALGFVDDQPAESGAVPSLVPEHARS